MFNWKFILGILVLAVLMTFSIPLVKIFLDWLASVIPVARPVAAYANRT